MSYEIGNFFFLDIVAELFRPLGIHRPSMSLVCGSAVKKNRLVFGCASCCIYLPSLENFLPDRIGSIQYGDV